MDHAALDPSGLPEYVDNEIGYPQFILELRVDRQLSHRYRWFHDAGDTEARIKEAICGFTWKAAFLSIPSPCSHARIVST